MLIKFEGAEKLNARLQQMTAQCPQECSRFMKMESELVKGRVKMKTPVDTGHLRNSWSSQLLSPYSAEIYNNTHYAPYVEYGHRVKIRGKFTGKVVPGVFMLRDGIEESAGQFQADAAKILARIFK